VKKKESNLGIISELIELKIIRFHVMTTETSKKCNIKIRQQKKRFQTNQSNQIKKLMQ